MTRTRDHRADEDRDPALLVRPNGKSASYWPDAMPPEPLEPTPTVTPTRTPGPSCDPSHPTVCIPPPSTDLDCDDVSFRNFKVIPPDPHGFDSDNDGVGCET